MAETATVEPYKPVYRNYVLFILFLGYVVNALDRSILNILLPAIQEEFSLSYTQLGLLGGIAFALFYATCGIPIASLADRICVMNHAEVLQIGPPTEVYARPATRFVASFIGSPAMNFLPAAGGLPAGATAVRVGAAEIAVPPTTAPLAGEAVLGARPEHIVLADTGPLRGRVSAVEYMGARQLVTVETDAGPLKVRAPNDTRVAGGETVSLAFLTERLSVFDGASDRSVTAGGADG